MAKTTPTRPLPAGFTLSSFAPAFDPRTATVDALPAHLAALGLEVPARIVDAYDKARRVVDKASALRTKPVPQVGPDDVLADDFEDRVLRALDAERLRETARPLAAKAAAQAQATVRAVIRKAIPEMFDQLEAWFLEHLDDLATPTLPAGATPGQRYAHADRVAATIDYRVAFERAHQDFMRASSASSTPAESAWRSTDATPFTTCFEWTPAQWHELIDVTGPSMSLRQFEDLYSQSLALGATPRLARSFEQAINHLAELREQPEHQGNRAIVLG